MKLKYDISWILIRIPILPWLKITKIEPQVRIVKVPKEIIVEVPTPEPTEEPTTRAIDYPYTINYPKVRKAPVFNLDKAIYKHTGKMAGTETYRLHNIRQDLIKFFVHTNNEAMPLHSIRKHALSPFRHNYVKCTPDCTHRVASDAGLFRALNNCKYNSENLEEMFGTKTIFVMEQIPHTPSLPTKHASKKWADSSRHFHGFRLSDEVYFKELNRLTRSDFATRTLAKEVEVTTTTKKETPAWRKEAIDRMT